MLTIGSLFSGIGGLELGLEWAGLGPVVWQVEKEPFCRAVLAKHWPNVERHDDVCTVGRSNLAAVDLICGGFPCQDVSSAGTREGLTGNRSGLWREYARVVAELRPSWCVVENVASGAAQWLDAVIGELDALGYACLPCPVSARDVGALHRRERIFVVAHRDGARELQSEGRESGERGRTANGVDSLGATDLDGIDGLGQSRRGEPGRTVSTEPDRTGEARDIADAVSDSGAQGRQHLRPRESDPARSASDATNTHDPGREGSGPGEQAQGRKGPARHPGWALESGLVPLVHGLSGGLAGRRRRARIRALGNAVVPQCAQVVGSLIVELINETLTPEHFT